MQSNRIDLINHGSDGLRERKDQRGHAPPDTNMSMNPGAMNRYDDSWVEISSQPSSSSLSSATDEIVTTGLRVQHDSNARRRRRVRNTAGTQHNIQNRSISAGGSSQEEYEESESESDRVMTSSNEGPPLHISLHPQSPPSAPRSTSSEEAAYEEDEEDERSTALGIVITEQCFTPQPNAFSHPPASQSTRPGPDASSYFPSSKPNTRPAAGRRSDPGQRARQHTSYNMISPSYQADHDQALRASLSTLLSLGAAARGLPKSTSGPATRAQPTSRIDPATIRMVPESALPGSSNALKGKPPVTRRVSGQSSASNSSADVAALSSDKGKRKATARSSSKDRRSVKKVRRMSSFDETLSPTLFTWVVSAGVVVLVSAISFSAGYAMGKEAGMAEGRLLGGTEGGSCGKEAVKGGFRRLRWTVASSAVTA